MSFTQRLGRAMPALLPALCVIITAAPAGAADWPHWRGPSRNDITTESSGYEAKAWPPKKRTWAKRLGYGSTSPIVVGKDRLYVMGWIDGKDYVYCFDAATGKEIWKQSYACRAYGRFARGDQVAYKGVTSTPEYDRRTNCIYTLSTDGHLHCYNAENGADVWNFNLYDKYRVPRRPGNRDYGYTSSPLAMDDCLIVEAGGSEGCLMAFDKRTGKRLWSSRAKDPAGHTGGPVPMTVRNVPCIAAFTCAGLLVTRTDKGHEGQTIATYPWLTDYNNNIAAPAVFADKVLITSDYNQNRMCLFDITLKGIAKRREVKRDYSKVATPVIYNNHIYIPYKRFRCYRIDKDGLKLAWEGQSSQFDFGDEGSCLLTADKRLIVFGARAGKCRLALIDTADRSPNQARLLAVNEDVFAGIKRSRRRAWPRVILANGRIYCKDREGNIVCLPLRP